MTVVKNIVVSTAYFPPVEYFARIAAAEQCFIDPYEHYLKQTYRNRCLIMTAGGIMPLVIPVMKPSVRPARVNEVLIDYGQKWQRLHWRALLASYSKSPYFLHYRDSLEPFFVERIPCLFEFNNRLFYQILSFLSLDVRIKYAKAYADAEKMKAIDLRDVISPKKPAPCFFASYTQVFSDRIPFHPNLSILDLLFNEGPYAKEYLRTGCTD